MTRACTRRTSRPNFYLRISCICSQFVPNLFPICSTHQESRLVVAEEFEVRSRGILRLCRTGNNEWEKIIRSRASGTEPRVVAATSCRRLPCKQGLAAFYRQHDRCAVRRLAEAPRTWFPRNKRPKTGNRWPAKIRFSAVGPIGARRTGNTIWAPTNQRAPFPWNKSTEISAAPVATVAFPRGLPEHLFLRKFPREQAVRINDGKNAEKMGIKFKAMPGKR